MLELDQHYSGWIVAGTDEAGRGPLFGPVTAAAVILDPAHPIEQLNDSKQLTEKRRDQLFDLIREHALTWHVAHCSAREIDQYNILQASHLAMVRAVEGLSRAPDKVLVDGNRIPRTLALPAEAVVKGDGRHSAIAAASVMAKVTRDRLIADLAEQYPGYDLERNKGYPTPSHLQALQQLGVTPQHRRSFAPVRTVLEARGEIMKPMRDQGQLTL